MALLSGLNLITLTAREATLIPDQHGILFLQWCLPKLHLRWPGFRKVRRQIYKRISRRMTDLALSDVKAYRDYLQAHPEEWRKLDAFCWIGISRFYRDHRVFERLEKACLPDVARRTLDSGERELHCWSAGCAGGEEPYTLALLFHYQLAPQFPLLGLNIIATDVDPRAIRQARRACFPASSLKELPAGWRAQAFDWSDEELCLKNEYRGGVTFLPQDIRERLPEGPFHVILCRNLVFTYFDDTLQKRTLEGMAGRLLPGGILVIGKGETIPAGPWGIDPWLPELGIFRKLQ